MSRPAIPDLRRADPFASPIPSDRRSYFAAINCNFPWRFDPEPDPPAPNLDNSDCDPLVDNDCLP